MLTIKAYRLFVYMCVCVCVFVRQIRLSDPDFSPRWYWFSFRIVRVQFVVGKMALKQDFLQVRLPTYFGFSLSVNIPPFLLSGMPHEVPRYSTLYP
jgi:hypothetical protein